MLNPAFRTQPIREGVDLNNTIKKKWKRGNYTEASGRDLDVGEVV